MYKHILRSLFVFSIVWSITNPIVSQDLHFTNYMVIPSNFNPAQTGNFLGTVRAGLIFRDQWEFNRGTSGTPFRTFGFGADMPVIYGFKKNHWVGAGITMMTDQVGISGSNQERTPSDLTQKWNRFAPSLAYHIGLDKKFNSVVTIGVQYAGTSLNYDGTEVITDRWLTGGVTTDIDNLSGQNEIAGNYSSINVGVMYKTKLNKVDTWEIGAGVMHLQGPKLTLLGNTLAKINQRINVHTIYRSAINKKFTIEPALFASFMGPASNIEAQFRSLYRPDKKKDFSFVIGAGYRVGDAPQLLTGAEWDNWVVSISYDHSLTPVGEISPHTLELGVRRIFTLNKRPEEKPVLYCPRL